MRDTSGTVVVLPDDFIGKEDEARLESFGGYLVEHGLAMRWRWRHSRGIYVVFELFRGTSDQDVTARIGRDSSKNVFHAGDPIGARIVEGSLDRVMETVNRLAESLARGPAI